MHAMRRGLASSREATVMSHCPRPRRIQQRCMSRRSLQPEDVDPHMRGFQFWHALREMSQKIVPHRCDHLRSLRCRRPPSFDAHADVCAYRLYRRVKMQAPRLGKATKSMHLGRARVPPRLTPADSSPLLTRICFLGSSSPSGHRVRPWSRPGALHVRHNHRGAHGPLPQRPARVIASSTES